MVQQRHYPLLGLCLFLPAGLGALLWTSWSLGALFDAVRTPEPVVVVYRIAFVGWGAGLSLIGVAMGAGLVDLLSYERWRKPTVGLFLGGFVLMVALPLPANLILNHHLVDSGYTACASSGFKLAKRAWAQDMAQCPDP